MSRDPLELSGGMAIRYGACTIIDLRKRSIAKEDPIQREEGIKIGVTVTKNHAKTDVYPYLKTEYYGIFGQGTERYLEAIDLAVEAGHLSKAGAYIRIPDENGEAIIVDGMKMQWQGAAKFRSYCIDNPDFFNELVSQLEGKAEAVSDEEAETFKALEQEENKSSDLSDDPMEKSSKAKKK